MLWDALSDRAMCGSWAGNRGNASEQVCIVSLPQSMDGFAQSDSPYRAGEERGRTPARCRTVVRGVRTCSHAELHCTRIESPAPVQRRSELRGNFSPRRSAPPIVGATDMSTQPCWYRQGLLDHHISVKKLFALANGRLFTEVARTWRLGGAGAWRSSGVSPARMTACGVCRTSPPPCEVGGEGKKKAARARSL